MRCLAVAALLGACLEVRGGAAPAAGSAAGCGGSASGSGSGACPTPKPTSNFQTVLTWDCHGRVRFMPDNKLVNINLDMPMLPRLAQKFYDGIKKYIRGHCSGKNVRDSTLNQRFHPVEGMLYGNKMYSTSNDGYEECLDDDSTFTRDFPKLYKALAGESWFEMPSSCKWDSWNLPKDPTSPRLEERDPKCSFTHQLMEIGASLQVVVKRCEKHRDFFMLSIGCQGTGCNIFTPCTDHADCEAKDHLICANPLKWTDLKDATSEPKFKEQDVYDFLKDNLRFYGNDYVDPVTKQPTHECPAFLPGQIFKRFILKFAPLFIRSPEEGGRGVSCTSDPDSECRVCMPAHTTAFETSISDFPGRWREVSEVYPKNRNKYDSDGCALSPTRLSSNDSTLVGDDKNNPTILAPIHPKDAGGALKYPGHVQFFDTESPIVQGAMVFLAGTQQPIGGTLCSTHAQCGTGATLSGLCIDSNEDYCALAQDECDRHSICELDAGGVCIPIHPSPVGSPAPKKCACFAIDRFTYSDTDANLLVYGSSCEKSMFIPNIDAEDILDSFYSTAIHKWRSRYDPFVHWDGVTAADGLDPFVDRDHWVRLPDMRAPPSDHHFSTLQCEGPGAAMHFFMKTPYHIRLYSPMINELLQFGAEEMYDSWKKCRDSKRILNQLRFLAHQAIYRPEPWLYAKVWDREYEFDIDKIGFDTLLFDVFNKTPSGFDYSTEEFKWNWYHHLVQLSEAFTLTAWRDNGYIGTYYRGLTGSRLDGVRTPLVFDEDFKLQLRLKNCPEYPMGLAEVHVTCNGTSCGEILLTKPCITNDMCRQSKCLSVFESVYDKDYPAQVLWGVDRPVPKKAGGQDEFYTTDSFCPVLEGVGKRGSTSKEPGVAVRQMTRNMWSATRYAGCPNRPTSECWNHCNLLVDKNKVVSCVYPPNKGPDEDYTNSTAPMKVCAPDLHVMMEKGFKQAVVFDKQFALAMGKNGSGGTGSMKPGSAAIFDLWFEFVREKLATMSTIFSLRQDTVDLKEVPRAAMLREPIYKAVYKEETATFGKSFIAVMIVMALIVGLASAIVYRKYVYASADEKDRRSRLRGLSFAFKQDTSVYGRDLMIPEMYKRWLPGEVLSLFPLTCPPPLLPPISCPPCVPSPHMTPSTHSNTRRRLSRRRP